MCATVLVVEDEPLIRLHIASVFAEAGFEVVETGSGDEAMSFLQSCTNFDVVFSDIEMPGNTNGMMLCQHIFRTRPSTTVILSSGKHLPYPKQLPPNARFIAKPYVPTVLEHAVEELRRQFSR